MAKTLIQNISGAPITLPLPYSVVLPSGGGVVVSDTVAAVSAAMFVVPGMESMLALSEVAEGNSVGSVPPTISMGGQKLTGLGAPTANTDAATKLYVDTHGGGGSGTVTSITAGTGLTGGTITASGTIALSTPVAVANGGTGLTTGTSGGVPYFSAATTVASSAALTANALVIGGGAGAAPAALGSLGTTTTVLHGNAAGAPTFGAVSLTADVSGTLPVGSGGTGIAADGSSNGVVSLSAGVSSLSPLLSATRTVGAKVVNTIPVDFQLKNGAANYAGQLTFWGQLVGATLATTSVAAGAAGQVAPMPDFATSGRFLLVADANGVVNLEVTDSTAEGVFLIYGPGPGTSNLFLGGFNQLNFA